MFNEYLYIWFWHGQTFFLDQNDPKIFINEPLAQFAVSFVSVFHGLFEDSEWSLRTRAWKQRKKSSWVIPKVVTLAYESFSLLTKLKSQFKQGFTKAAVTKVVARKALTLLQ